MKRGVCLEGGQALENRMQIWFFVMVLLFSSFVYASWFGNEKSFDVDLALIKVVVSEEEDTIKILTITSNEDNDFSLELDGLDFVSLNESGFHLGVGEKKEVEVILNSSDKDYGIYSGELVVLDGKISRIPVIMEIESEEVLFDSNVNVPLEYVDVFTGDNVVFENKIFNLENIGSESVEVSYFVRSFEGKEFWSDEENLVVSSQLTNSKTVVLPDDLDEGNYLFGVVIGYKNSVGTSSYLFEVEKSVDCFSFVGENLLMWVVIIMLVCLIFFVIYYTKKRDRILLELHRDYKREIGKTAESIEKERVLAEKLKGSRKVCAMKNIKKKTKQERAAKKIYAKRVETVKTLRKHRKESEVEKKLREWKKEGYRW